MISYKIINPFTWPTPNLLPQNDLHNWKNPPCHLNLLHHRRHTYPPFLVPPTYGNRVRLAFEGKDYALIPFWKSGLCYKKKKKVETESGKRLNGRSYIIDHTTRLQRLIVIYTMKWTFAEFIGKSNRGTLCSNRDLQ